MRYVPIVVAFTAILVSAQDDEYVYDDDDFESTSFFDFDGFEGAEDEVEQIREKPKEFATLDDTVSELTKTLKEATDPDPRTRSFGGRLGGRFPPGRMPPTIGRPQPTINRPQPAINRPQPKPVNVAADELTKNKNNRKGLSKKVSQKDALIRSITETLGVSAKAVGGKSRCLRCHNAPNAEACLSSGWVETCNQGQGCETSMRFENGKTKIDSVCKQRNACKVNARQNANCHEKSSKKINRSCWSCCFGDLCNVMELNAETASFS